MGKHKLAPVLSPKKTIEGSVGGVAGAGVLGVVYAMVFGKLIVMPRMETMLVCCICCMAVAIVSQIGDLSASAIKRAYGVKDYGTLIPGHGGILDRFDSVLFAAPAMYIVLLLLGV